MAYTREQYSAGLTQLNNNIAALEQQISIVENARDQALMQRAVSILFTELNDNTEKSIVLPVSKFVYAINASNTFYKLEAAGEMDLVVHRDAADKYTAESKCFFARGELEEMCKNATFTDGKTTLKLAAYRATPAFFFAGCEPKQSETVVSVTEVTAQPTAPTAPVIQETPSVQNA